MFVLKHTSMVRSDPLRLCLKEIFARLRSVHLFSIVVKFGIFTATKVQVVVFWVVNKVLRCDGILPHHYTTPATRRL